jgi:uncharacterized protein YaaQ
MSGSGLSTWLLIGVVVVGVYVLPSVTAKFAGSHTMEFNASSTGQTNASGMDCGQCHGYISDELNATGTGGTDRVLQQHINALEDTNYANDNTTGSGGFLRIGNYTGITKTSVCPLCHATETRIDGSHTQVVTRVCTDVDCHGYNDTKFGTSAIVYGGQNVTQKLNKSTDVHQGWYTALEAVNSGRAMANESEYSQHSTGGKPAYGQGYLTCLACHTHFGMNMNISRSQSFNVNISINSAGDVTIDPTVAVNSSDLNVTFSVKDAHQTVWT